MWKRNKAMGWRHSVAAVARRIGRGVGRNDSRERQSADIEFEDMGNPPKAQFAQAMHALVERGVSAFLLYSGSVTQNYSYADQFADAFRGESFVGKIRCDFAVDLDHTVSLIASQQRVVRLARDWVATIS